MADKKAGHHVVRQRWGPDDIAQLQADLGYKNKQMEELLAISHQYLWTIKHYGKRESGEVNLSETFQRLLDYIHLVYVLIPRAKSWKEVKSNIESLKKTQGLTQV